MTIKEKMEQFADRLYFDTVGSYQVMAVESICDGRDTFFVSSSSCEKSEIVLYAALLNEKRPIVVIEPTISLINLQMYNVKFLEEPYKATSLTECNREDHNELLKKFKNHKFNVLYVTPDRLKEKYFRKAMEEIEPWLVVVNEAHLVQEDWGKRFRSPYLEIKKFINSLSHRPTMLAMTGTAPPTDRKDIWDNLGLIDPKEIILSVDNSTVSVIVENHSNYVSKTKKARQEYLLECVKKNIEKYGGKGVIVYALTPHDVETIADYLDVRFIGEVTMSHGDMEKEERTINEELFLMDK